MTEIPKKLIAGIALLIIIIIILIKSSVTIESGEAGVLFRTFAGGVETEETYGEGFHFIACLLYTSDAADD